MEGFDNPIPYLNRQLHGKFMIIQYHYQFLSTTLQKQEYCRMLTSLYYINARRELVLTCANIVSDSSN